MTRKKSYLGVAIVSLVALPFILFETVRFHAKCDTLAATSTLQKRIYLSIPPNKLENFSKKLENYLDNNSFTFESSKYDSYVSPPNESGEQTVFRNVKTVGCTYKTIVWSENVVKEDQLFITIHSTVFGDKETALRVATEVAQLR